MFTYINETISGRFDQQDIKELYSQAGATEAKFQDFNERCVNSPSGPYLKYIGTSSTVLDLVSLGDAIVGEGEPIDYWGVSYGTVLGFNFLNSESRQPFCLPIQLKTCRSVPRGMANPVQMSANASSVHSAPGILFWTV